MMFLDFIDRTSPLVFIILALTLGLAPFFPQPHLLEKLAMLAGGTLSRPVDIFDLLLHGTPWVLLAIKIVRLGKQRNIS